MLLKSEYIITVIKSFEQLLNNLEQFRVALCEKDQHLPAWFQAPMGLPIDNNMGHRNKAFQMLNQLEFLDSQKPREILVGAGLFAASSHTIDIIDQLNNAKNNFKKSILALRAANISNKDPDLIQQITPLITQRDDKISNTLRKIGFARLHLKQCYRKIPFFNYKPLKVSWTWANTRSIKRITITEAMQLLNKMKESPGLEQQKIKLQTLENNESLAIVQELAPHLRANIVIQKENPNDLESKDIERKMVKGPVPLFYLDPNGQSLPEFQPPKNKHARDPKRNTRSDLKIDPNIFLPAIRAHRYI